MFSPSNGLRKRVAEANRFPGRIVFGLRNFDHDPARVRQMLAEIAATILDLQAAVGA